MGLGNSLARTASGLMDLSEALGDSGITGASINFLQDWLHSLAVSVRNEVQQSDIPG